VLVNDLRPGVGNGNPGLFTVAKGKLFFVVPNDIGNGLWVSNGTSDGTLMLKSYTGSAAARLTAAGDWLFFAADDQSGVGKELWGVYLGELKYVFLPLIKK
jgi:ELWxxDGT repeat protein